MTQLIHGIGAYFPVRAVSNETLAGLKGIDPRWIQRKTGIASRFLARDGIGTVHMAGLAARDALAQAGVEPEAVGLLVVASSFHGSFASTAAVLRRRLRLTNARPLDLATPPLGILDALSIALARPDTVSLVVGAEGFSDFTKLSDRRNCYLLSDGAGALLVSPHAGFARLQPRLVEGELGAARVAMAPDDQLCFGEAVRAFLERVRPPESGTTLHVISQAVNATMPTGLPPSVRIHNPFAETGHLLSAALPMAFYRLLRHGELSPGDRCALLSVTQEGAWSALELELLDMPPWVRGEAGPGSEEPLVIVGTPAELAAEIAAIARHSDPAVERPLCICLRLVLANEDSRRFQEMVELELVSFLKRRTRQTDSLLKLQGEPSCALVLRNIDEEDAARLCGRLKGALEDLDPAGELGFTVEVHLSRYEPSRQPEEWSAELMKRLAPC